MADSDDATPPKVFISYAWTDANHQKWVRSLAESLVNDRVDVIADFWDLKLGQDKYHFMERIVSDPSVKYVLMICNASYAKKADARTGGVGDETQIITPELYSSTANEKFIPVIAELDENGTPHLPAYLKTRIWIDLSSEQVFYDGYEKLLRTLWGKPDSPKPPLGTKPRFLEVNDAPVNSNPFGVRRAVSALAEDKRTAEALAAECLENLSTAVASLRFHSDQSRPLDEDVVAAIHRSKPIRDDYLELLEALCKFPNGERTEKLLFPFFEALLTSTHPQQPGGHYEAEFDGIRFLINELFLYTTSLLLKHDRVSTLVALLQETYVYRGELGTTKKSPYTEFCFSIDSLDRHRRQRLNLNRISLAADLVKERADRNTVSFERIQEADLLLFLRASFLELGRWWPRNLVHLGHYPKPFELFIAPESKRRFDRVRAVLDVRDAAHLRSRFEATFPEDCHRLLDFGGFMPIPLAPLMNLEDKK